MKGSKLIEKINEYTKKYGEDPDIFFDVEAATYNVHIVTIDYVSSLPKEITSSINNQLILGTKQEEARRH